ncbi:DUF3253 domain-containing protein [Methylovirgula sp. HY1]|uniref:DUF3253 domain-containing protein n=1 Tax=Methylovirgula sp. HY1 TaxID=2822761 RepID=UPI001C5BA615|nr:DUF3253 domain-containing protein [Methylovirgula sp. HY1]QXX75875.1 hypothetical protein MHY1_02708 [Methylovirgula sp. HY1]
MATSPKLADFILDLCAKAAASEMIDPEDVAKAFAKVSTNPNVVTWEGYLLAVKDNAVKLAKEGKIRVYRKGVAVDPETLKGVYRMGPVSAE